MAALVCPHCEVLVQFEIRYEWQETDSRRNVIRFGAWTCTNCWRGIVGQGTERIPGYPPSGIDPIPELCDPRTVTRLPEYPATLDPSILRDAQEAYMCLGAGAWRAAVVMARRAVQGAALDRGAPDKARLLDQIDWLESERHIIPVMKDVAHRIRLEGNAGAHPDRDGLRDIDEAAAREVVRFLDDFLRLLYEIPARLQGTDDAPSAPEEAVKG